MITSYDTGRIYLENCGESELQRAGECFTLAGQYELAPNAYARGNLFSECLNVCTKGRLYGMGLAYIEHWRKHGKNDGHITAKATDIEKIEQELLKSYVQ